MAIRSSPDIGKLGLMKCIICMKLFGKGMELIIIFWNSFLFIRHEEEIICSLATILCPQRYKFVFLWGKATITLGDVMFLGGFSVLDDPIFTWIKLKNWLIGKTKLSAARKEVFKTLLKKVNNYHWIEKFNGCDS